MDFWWKRQENVEKLSTKCGKLVEKCADVGIFDVEKCVRRHSANKKERQSRFLYFFLIFNVPIGTIFEHFKSIKSVAERGKTRPKLFNNMVAAELCNIPFQRRNNIFKNYFH